MVRHNLIRPLIGVLVSALLVAFAVISAMRIFGWFGLSQTTHSAGDGTQIKDAHDLEIRAAADRDDISVTMVSADMEKLPHNGGGSAMYPGVSGSFSFIVNDTVRDGDEPYNIQYSVSIQNNEFHDDAAYEDGFYAGTSDADRAQAMEYIRTHLLFFTDWDAESNTYSGWIRHGQRITHAGNEPITVYWVWVSLYDQLFSGESTLIEAATRSEIAAQYSKPENTGKVFLGEEMSSESYNMADTLIGVTLKYICYQIEVCEG